MKRITALFLLLVFSNIAVAHPFDSGGGGTSSSSEEADLTLIILVVIVAGVGTLFLTDILSEDSADSQDTLGNEGIVTEETGVNWDQLTGDQQFNPLPLIAVSVFPGENGRNLATYFSNLITQGNGLYYDIYSSPVSFGEMDASEAAETGFSFLSCQLFIAAGSSGLELYSDDSDAPVWFFNTADWDSSAVREASASFIEFAVITY